LGRHFFLVLEESWKWLRLSTFLALRIKFLLAQLHLDDVVSLYAFEVALSPLDANWQPKKGIHNLGVIMQYLPVGVLCNSIFLTSLHPMVGRSVQHFMNLSTNAEVWGIVIAAIRSKSDEYRV